MFAAFSPPAVLSVALRPHQRIPGRRACGMSATKSAFGESGTAVVLVDHGSKRAQANALVHEVVDKLQKRTTIPIFGAHMEMASPTIDDAVEKAVALGDVRHVVVVPFFLAPGRHATSDIPRMAEEAIEKYPGVSFQVAEPIGSHPAILDVVMARAGLADLDDNESSKSSE